MEAEIPPHSVRRNDKVVTLFRHFIHAPVAFLHNNNMSLNATLNSLDNAFRVALRQWRDSRALWNDPVAWSFEKVYWQPLEQQTQATQREMEALEQVMEQAKRHVK